MKKLNKKAFTIVELIVVIVIIGILAAILIPNVVKYIDQTKVIKDKELVSNLNKALAYDRLEKGIEIHETPTAALEAAQAHGYNVAVINKTSKDGNEILWDSVNDVYLYLEDGTKSYVPDFEPKKSVKDSQIWKISNTIDEQYATYYTGTETTVTVDKGFDAGESAVTSISLVRTASIEHDVVIRTNGGTLTINAKNDDVFHYGYADSVNVIDVATASYHENGTVKFLEVAAGHIVLEEDAEVSAVHFTATGEGNEAKFENAEGKTISIDLSKVSKENMPSFSRDAVNIDDNGTYVAEVKIDSTEYIWLFGNGIKEQMVVTESTGAIADNGTLKAGITAGAEDGSVAEQIANPAKRNDAGELVDENNVVINLTDVDFTKADALEDVEVVVEQVASKEDVQIGATLFAGGSGTKNDPFLIYNYETMQHITDLYEEGYYYFEVALDKTDNGKIDCNGWVSVKLCGSFDGKGVEFINVTNDLFMYVYGDDIHTTVNNFKINANIVKSGYGAAALAQYIYGTDLHFEDISIAGYVEGYGNSSLLLAYGGFGTSYTINASFKNINISATMVCTGGNAGILIGHSYSNTNSEYTFEDCTITSSVSSTGGKAYYFPYLKGDNVTKPSSKCTFITNGVVTETVYNDLGWDSAIKEYSGCATLKVNSNENPDQGATFTCVKNSNYNHAIAALIIGPNGKDYGTNYVGTYMVESNENGLIITDSAITTTNIKYYICTSNQNHTIKTGVSSDGVYYNVVNPNYNNVVGSASVRLIQYDSNGNIVQIDTWDITPSN